MSLATLSAAASKPGPVLVLFVARECPTSRMTLGRLQALNGLFEEAGGAIVAVHEDDAQVASATMRACKATYTALSEPAPYRTSAAWQVATLPTAFLIDADGTVADSVVGWSREDFDRIAARVSVAGGGSVAVTSEHPHAKPGCASKNTLDPALSETLGQGLDEVEDMFERGWTDGLPVVVPTRERVERMLGDCDGGVSLGPVPPGMGELTLERLAACAVLAGCHPSYFPLVRAAAAAALDPAFNLHGQTNTTHTSGPVLIVNGPIRQRLAMNSGINAMGGWNRANATVGRTIRLMTGLTGRGRPGLLDRSTLGQPGKISFCFAENEEDSPWRSLAETLGYEDQQSVVTLYCGDAPFSVSDHYSRNPEDLVTSLALAGAAVFSPHFYPLAAQTVFVISPEHAASLAAAGWSKDEVAQRIFDASKRRVDELVGGEQGPFVAALDGETELAKWSSPSEVVIVVSGGRAGRFSAVLPPWVGFGLGSSMVSREV